MVAAPPQGDFEARRALVVAGRLAVRAPAFLAGRPPGPAVLGAGRAGAGRLTASWDRPVATLASVTAPSATRLAPPTTIEPVTETAVPARDPACFAACSVAAATPTDTSVPTRLTVAPKEDRPPRHRRTRPKPASPTPMAMVSSSSMRRAYSHPSTRRRLGDLFALRRWLADPALQLSSGAAGRSVEPDDHGPAEDDAVDGERPELAGLEVPHEEPHRQVCGHARHDAAHEDLTTDPVAVVTQ